MKFLVPNYSCLQNPWLGCYRPQIPVFSVLCPQLNLLTLHEQNSWVRHWCAVRKWAKCYKFNVFHPEVLQHINTACQSITQHFILYKIKLAYYYGDMFRPLLGHPQPLWENRSKSYLYFKALWDPKCLQIVLQEWEIQKLLYIVICVTTCYNIYKLVYFYIPVTQSVSICDLTMHWNTSASSGRIFMKFGIRGFLKNCRENFRRSIKMLQE